MDYTKQHFTEGEKLNLHGIYNQINPGNRSPSWEQRNELLNLHNKLKFSDEELNEIIDYIVSRNNRSLEEFGGVENLISGTKSEWSSALGLKNGRQRRI